MKTASTISKPGSEARETSRAERRRKLHRERREFYGLLAPPDVRHRRREARRWLDEETVRITNPPFSEQRPGERLFTSMEERLAVADALYDALRRDDPELLRAVQRLTFEDGIGDCGITLEEWKVRSARRSKRISRIRAEMRAAGLISIDGLP